MKLDNPIIVQSDRSILVEVDNPLYTEARDALAQFAELEKSPEHIHTYRISPLSLWNAAAGGMQAESIIDLLASYSKYPLPQNINTEIRTYINRYGRLKLVRDNDTLLLVTDEANLLTEVLHQKRMQPYIIGQRDRFTLEMDSARRGHIKQALIHLGFPAEDLAGYSDGSPLPIRLSEMTRQGGVFKPRHYQEGAVGAFYAGGAPSGGSGVIVLPCGAGKTIGGMMTIATLQRATLILTPNTVAVRQWIHELLDKTDIPPEMVAEYTGERKDIAPITITTYQMLTYRRTKGEPENGQPIQEAYPHFGLFTSYDWGLIVYDEVHLLPAPIFRMTAEIQARRRRGR